MITASNMQTISVQGKGTVQVSPDIVRLEINVDRHFPDYTRAYTQARENTICLNKILAQNNLPSSMVKTVKFDINDHRINEYDSSRNLLGEMTKGYDLQQTLKVDLPINNILCNSIVRGVGKLLTGAEISISFTIEDIRPHQLKLLGEAVEDARDKANIMAKSLGCYLGRVHSVNYIEKSLTPVSHSRTIHPNKEATNSTAETFAITPEDLAITDYADVVWELVNP